MAFRLGYPAISEQRCKACVVMGGTVIEDAATAEAFTRAMQDSKAWGSRGMDPAPVRLGEAFELQPCMPKNWPLRTEDRPCPRVELWPENELAARIAYAALPEHTRPLLPDFLAAVTRGLDPDYAARSTVRAMQVLQGEAVGSWMRKQLEPEEKD